MFSLTIIRPLPFSILLLTAFAASHAFAAGPMTPVTDLDVSGPSTFYETYFDADKATLNSAGHRVVDKAARKALADPSYRIKVVGKSSSVEADSESKDARLEGDSATFTLTLSRRRADTVRLALMTDGVASDRINLQWLSDSEMPYAGIKGVSDSLNQVVETVVSR